MTTATRSAGVVAIARALLDADPRLDLRTLVSQTADAGGVTQAEARALVDALWQARQPATTSETTRARKATPRASEASGEVSGAVNMLTVLLDRWQLAQEKIRHYEQQRLMGHELFWRTLSVHSAQLLGLYCSPYWTRVAESERDDLARCTRVLDNRPLEAE